MRAVSFVLVPLVLAFATSARAEGPLPPTTSQAASPTTAKPQPNAPGWGVALAATGIVAGGSLAAYGLTFDCVDASVPCQKRAAIAFWGGIGIAALSSAVGIAIIQSATRPGPARASLRLDVAGPGVLLHGRF